jgi:hypothetical protein
MPAGPAKREAGLLWATKAMSSTGEGGEDDDDFVSGGESRAAEPGDEAEDKSLGGR